MTAEERNRVFEEALKDLLAEDWRPAVPLSVVVVGSQVEFVEGRRRRQVGISLPEEVP